MSIVFVLLLLLSLIGFSFFIVRLTGWSPEVTPIFVISVIIGLLYLFAFFGILQLATYTLFGLGYVLLTTAAFLSRKHLIDQIKSYFRPGIVLFIFFFILMAQNYIDFHYRYWDEFSHWGLSIKEIYYSNGFIGESSTLPLKDYPPGTALFQYFVAKIVGYSEGTVYFATNLILLAAIVNLLQGITWKRLHWALGILLFSYLMNSSIGGNFDVIYVDNILSLLFGTVAASLLISRNRESWVNTVIQVLPIIFILPLIKSTGTLLSYILILIIITNSLFKAKQCIFQDKNSISYTEALKSFLTSNRSKLVKISLVLFVLTLTPFLATSTWNTHIKSIKANQTFKTDFSFLKLKSSFSNDTASNRDKVTIKAFVNAFENTELAKGVTTKKLILIFGLTLIIAYYFYNSDPEARRLFVVTHTILFLGFIIYTIGLLLMYLYSFTEYEGTRLASFERYMVIYLLGWSFPIFISFTINIQKRLFSLVITAILLLLFSITPFANVFAGSGLIKENPGNTISPMRQKISEITNTVNKQVDTNSKVYIVWQNSNGFEHRILKYEMAPRYSNDSSWSIGEPYNKDDVWTTKWSPEEWASVLKSYDYVLIGNADESFWEKYKPLFSGNETAVYSKLFKIEKNNDSVILVSVNKKAREDIAQKLKNVNITKDNMVENQYFKNDADKDGIADGFSILLAGDNSGNSFTGIVSENGQRLNVNKTNTAFSTIRLSKYISGLNNNKEYLIYVKYKNSSPESNFELIDNLTGQTLLASKNTSSGIIAVKRRANNKDAAIYFNKSQDKPGNHVMEYSAIGIYDLQKFNSDYGIDFSDFAPEEIATLIDGLNQ